MRWTLVALVLLATCGVLAPVRADAQTLCESCEVQTGLGGTYHFWAPTGGVVLPVLVDFSDARYEVGFFRVTTQQVLHDDTYRDARIMANPFWGMSLSRRWSLYERGPVRVFFGFGLAGKTKTDELSSTRVDFASQLGVRFRLPGDHVVGELTMRHWSNAGIRLPNHGEDFVTLTFRVNSGLFGVPRAERIPLDPSFADADYGAGPLP